MPPLVQRFGPLFLFALCLILAGAAAFVWLERPSEIPLIEPVKKEANLPPNGFRQTSEKYTNIGPPILELKYSPPKLELPDLRQILVYHGKNGRPDADTANPALYFSLQGNQGISQALASLTLGGKLYLAIQRDGGPAKFTFSPKNEETPLWITVQPVQEQKGNEVEVTLHIQEIDPIESAMDIRWALSVQAVLVIGSLVYRGRFFTEKVIGIGGSGFIADQTGFFRTREGVSLSHLIQGRLIGHPEPRIISGDVLLGKKSFASDFLSPRDFSLVAIPEPEEREFLHFFRLGANKYSFSGAYLSGHLAPPPQGYFFSTSQHGEERAFIDSTLVDKVNPFHVPVFELVKAVMVRDFDKAEELGLCTVVPEDFALPTFVCPSKIPMLDIMREGISAYLKESMT